MDQEQQYRQWWNGCHQDSQSNQSHYMLLNWVCQSQKINHDVKNTWDSEKLSWQQFNAWWWGCAWIGKVGWWRMQYLDMWGCSAIAIQFSWRYSVALARGSPSFCESLAHADRGFLAGLAPVILHFSRTSVMYLAWNKWRPASVWRTWMPKNKWRGPRSLIAKKSFRQSIKWVIALELFPFMIISSTYVSKNRETCDWWKTNMK